MLHNHALMISVMNDGNKKNTEENPPEIPVVIWLWDKPYVMKIPFDN